MVNWYSRSSRRMGGLVAGLGTFKIMASQSNATDPYSAIRKLLICTRKNTRI